eukprot:Rmarinus@m.11515
MNRRRPPRERSKEECDTDFIQKGMTLEEIVRYALRVHNLCIRLEAEAKYIEALRLREKSLQTGGILQALAALDKGTAVHHTSVACLDLIRLANCVAVGSLKEGNTEACHGFLKKACVALERSEGLLSADDLLKMRATTYNNLACYHKKERPHAALQHCKIALQCESRRSLQPHAVQDWASVAPTCLNMASILSSMHRHKEALMYAKKAHACLMPEFDDTPLIPRGTRAPPRPVSARTAREWQSRGVRNDEVVRVRISGKQPRQKGGAATRPSGSSAAISEKRWEHGLDALMPPHDAKENLEAKNTERLHLLMAACYNMAVSLEYLGRVDEAMTWYQRANAAATHSPTDVAKKAVLGTSSQASTVANAGINKTSQRISKIMSNLQKGNAHICSCPVTKEPLKPMVKGTKLSTMPPSTVDNVASMMWMYKTDVATNKTLKPPQWIQSLSAAAHRKSAVFPRGRLHCSSAPPPTGVGSPPRSTYSGPPHPSHRGRRLIQSARTHSEDRVSAARDARRYVAAEEFRARFDDLDTSGPALSDSDDAYTTDPDSATPNTHSYPDFDLQETGSDPMKPLPRRLHIDVDNDTHLLHSHDAWIVSSQSTLRGPSGPNGDPRSRDIAHRERETEEYATSPRSTATTSHGAFAAATVGPTSVVGSLLGHLDSLLGGLTPSAYSAAATAATAALAHMSPGGTSGSLSFAPEPSPPGTRVDPRYTAAESNASSGHVDPSSHLQQAAVASGRVYRHRKIKPKPQDFESDQSARTGCDRRHPMRPPTSPPAMTRPYLPRAQCDLFSPRAMRGYDTPTSVSVSATSTSSSRQSQLTRKDLEHAILTIQRIVRGFLARRKIRVIKQEFRSATTIQRLFRGKLARNVADGLRQTTAALVLQRMYRGRTCRRLLENKKREKRGAITLQRIYRGHKARKIAMTLKSEMAWKAEARARDAHEAALRAKQAADVAQREAEQAVIDAIAAEREAGALAEDSASDGDDKAASEANGQEDGSNNHVPESFRGHEFSDAEHLAAIKIQSQFRGLSARRRAETLREHNSGLRPDAPKLEQPTILRFAFLKALQAEQREEKRLDTQLAKEGSLRPKLTATVPRAKLKQRTRRCTDSGFFNLPDSPGSPSGSVTNRTMAVLAEDGSRQSDGPPEYTSAIPVAPEDSGIQPSLPEQSSSDKPEVFVAEPERTKPVSTSGLTSNGFIDDRSVPSKQVKTSSPDDTPETPLAVAEPMKTALQHSGETHPTEGHTGDFLQASPLEGESPRRDGTPEALDVSSPSKDWYPNERSDDGAYADVTIVKQHTMGIRKKQEDMVQRLNVLAQRLDTMISPTSLSPKISSNSNANDGPSTIHSSPPPNPPIFVKDPHCPR